MCHPFEHIRNPLWAEPGLGLEQNQKPDAQNDMNPKLDLLNLTLWNSDNKNIITDKSKLELMA